MINTNKFSRLKKLMYMVFINIVFLFSSMKAAHAESGLMPAFNFAKGFLNYPNFTESDDYSINDDVWITSYDGTGIAANVITLLLLLVALLEATQSHGLREADNS